VFLVMVETYLKAAIEVLDDLPEVLGLAVVPRVWKNGLVRSITPEV
jgi:hypothetical protein